MGDMSPAIMQSPFSFFRNALTTSFTPRRIPFTADAFFTSLCSFFVNFFDANGFEIGLGNATAKANATAIVSGKRFNIGTSDVTVLAKAKALPSGEGFELGTSDITLRMWEAVPTNATQTWTEIP